MRAALFRTQAPIETNPLQFTDVPRPVAGPDEILIRVSACGVCRTDLHVIEGDLAARKSPLIPGHQIIGVVAEPGSAARGLKPGVRVGVPWLYDTCGACEYCRSGNENLCGDARFTGWIVDGGYAEYVIAKADYVYQIPDSFSDLEAAPLLCAGIIGFRSLRVSGITASSGGKRLGIYGFGNAAHIAIQIARHWNVEVFAFTRDRRHQALARSLGAKWAGGNIEESPEMLDSIIIFAPAGNLVPAALKSLKKGGTIALGGIHMSTIPPLDYQLLYGERVIRSVANNTRIDGREFLKAAAAIPIRPRVRAYRLEEANLALNALKNDAIDGAAVIDLNERN